MLLPVSRQATFMVTAFVYSNPRLNESASITFIMEMMLKCVLKLKNINKNFDIKEQIKDE